MRTSSPSLLALLLLLVTIIRSGRACSNGWLSHGRYCYKIYTEPTKNKNSAEAVCNRESGKLASISSPELLNYLASQTAYTSGNNFWVGLYHLGNGIWKWNNNESALEQPWITIPTRPVPDCFSFNGAKVAYKECSETLGYICESLKQTAAVNCSSLGPLSFVNEEMGKCFFRAETMMKKQEAEAYCVSNGGLFADINDEILGNLQNFYDHKIFDDDVKSYWINLTWSETQNVSFSWHISTNLIHREGECVTVTYSEMAQYHVHLYQENCDGTAYVVCSAPSRPLGATTHPVVSGALQQDLKCPSGYNWKADRVTNYCYWETSYETPRLSFDEARAYCKTFGGDLSSLHSIEEEKIGLSFQYGSFAHPYWIGLRFNYESGEYEWSDGTPLDYTNWAPKHPTHRDMRERCAVMNASAKHWVSHNCGLVSWFICKAPKQVNPPIPVLPTREPPKSCETGTPGWYYFKGYCYRVVSVQYSWHRAKEHCENEDSSLVSIHTNEEIGFLLRLLYDSANMNGNLIWIGLNTLRVDGEYQWSDWTPVDFTYWNENEPNNFQGQEKCCNMYANNGLWNDKNCNEPMSFVCKKRNDTSFVPIVPTTQDPRIGNCQKGWLPFQDRCYLPMGKLENDRLNWTVATKVCYEKGGYLASIRSEEEQTFLTYVMQSLKEDTWIGLHDTIQSGRYYWADNSDLRYTNWGPGEPSFFGIAEDCVFMMYDSVNSGMWKDQECSRRHAYICQVQKDPKLPEPLYIQGTDCLHPEGWLKLDQMCFKMFVGTPKNWEEAEKSCESESAHLVSVTHFSVLAAVKYLATEANQSFWIGLRVEASTQQLSWLNGWPALLTRWEKNELGDITKPDQCFASSPEGYWKRLSCSEEMAYMCQVTAGNPLKKEAYTGNCPNSSDYWRPTTGSHCYLFDSRYKAEWFAGNFRCFAYGGMLVSIHSKEELVAVAQRIDDGIHSIYIGLTRNKKGGFTWTDKTPVDFVNWDVSEPLNSEDQCVEMRIDTHKWRVIPCLVRKHFLCSSRKENLVEHTSITAATFVADPKGGLSSGAVASVVFVVVVLVVVVLVGAIMLYYRPLGKSRFRIPLRQQSTSFENALFNADAVSLEFQTDGQEVPQQNC